MAGISSPPDPAVNAYRKDLADVDLAGQVIASHYAEPLLRHLIVDAELRASPAADAEVLGHLNKDDEFWLLDSTRGWAWGYAPDRRVGYIVADAIVA